MKTITLELSDTVYSLLKVLTLGKVAPFVEVEGVIYKLIDHAQQGVAGRRSWERDWLCQAFCNDWIQYMERGDPYGRPDSQKKFQRPKKRE